MSAAVLTQLPAVTAVANSIDRVIQTDGLFHDPAINGTVTQFNLNVGTFSVELFDSQTPLTVANFLHYVNDGDYTNTIIHRNAKLTNGTPFVVQGGGFRLALPPTAITTDPAVQNEPGISNVRGTIAMAKLGGNPNSATSQWFVNMGDNSANLDAQNGGFTVFGHVLGNGMATLDAIAALTNINAGGAFTDLPLTNYGGGPVALNNFVNVNSISTISETRVTGASSSNPNLVTVSLDANKNLVLHYIPRQTGTATITVNAASADGSVISQTFDVTVNEDPNQVAPVSMSTLGVKTVNYTEPDGTAVSLKFTSSSRDGTVAMLEFYGEGVTVNTVGSVTTLTGGASLFKISFSAASTLKSTFAITTKGGTDAGVATIDTIAGDTVIGKFSAPMVDLIGEGMIFTGSGYIGTIDLHDVKNSADIVLPGGQPFTPFLGITLNVDSTSDGSDITVSQHIKNLTANKIGSSDITTPFISSMTIKADPKAAANRALDGSFSADLTITGDGAPTKGGALPNIVISGAASGTWSVTGAGGKISVGSTAPSFDATFSSVLGSFATTVGALSGSITATQIGTITAKTDLASAQIFLSGAFSPDPKIQALGKLTVGNAISGSVVAGAGSFGAITAKSMANSFAYSGVSDFDLDNPPTSVAAFANTSNITSFTLTSTASDAFAGSRIAASTLTKVTLKKIDVTNNNVDFGVTADKIASISGVDGSGKTFTLTKLDDPALLPAKLNGLLLVDFTITLL